MRVLQVNTVYARGSTGRITQVIHEGLKALGHESFVAYGRGPIDRDDGVVRTSTELAAKWQATKARAGFLQYGGAARSTERIMRLALAQRPDVVHLHNLNGYFVNIYRLLSHLKSVGQPTVVTLHAEFMHTGGCGHALDCRRWQHIPGCGSCPQLREATKSLVIDRTQAAWTLMRDVFSDSLPHFAITSVSPWLRERAQASPILGHLPHHTVLNGLDTTVFRPGPATNQTLDGPTKEPLQLLHVTPYFTAQQDSWKGGRDILELAARCGDAVNVVVVGRTASNTRSTRNVTLVGRLEDNQALAERYRAADAVILTSKRETFSMVTAEALSCGTPVLGYRAGAPERIAIPWASLFVEQGDVSALTEACLTQFGPGGKFRDLDRRSISREAHDRYSKDRMIKEYLNVYRSVIKASRT